MLGWLALIIPSVIIIINIILNIILDRNRTDYLEYDREFRNNKLTPWKQSKKYKILKFLYKHETKGDNTMLTSVVVLIVLCIVLCFTYIETLNFVTKYETVVIEYTERSKSFSELEKAALFSYAVDLTATASVFKYWNKYFDPYVSDGVETLKPIK